MGAKDPHHTKPPPSLRKASKMDGDTKTLITVLVGLCAVLLLLIGGYGVFSYIQSQNRTSKTIIAKLQVPAKDAVDKVAGDAHDGSLSPVQPSAIEGVASSFDPDTAFEPGEVLLADPPPGFEDKIRADGFRVVEYISLSNLNMTLVRVRLPTDMRVATGIKRLSALLPGVSVDANHHFDLGTGPQSHKGRTPREMAGWTQLSPTCGRGLVLGQIDSGVDTTHPALQGQNIHYKSFANTRSQAGPNDHGTAIASMLVGKAEWGGLLPGAELYAANMFEFNNTGKKVGSSVGLLKSIDWMAANRVNAVNLSIAGSDNKLVRKAFDIAKKSALMMIAAVGNWGRSDRPAYPAAYDHVVAITATNGTELIYSHANSGDYVDFAAPGVGIYTAQPGGGGKLQSGTSFAAPYVTAMAAILAQAGKTPNAQTLRDLLSKVTRDLGSPGKDAIFGYGYLKVRPSCR